MTHVAYACLATLSYANRDEEALHPLLELNIKPYATWPRQHDASVEEGLMVTASFEGDDSVALVNAISRCRVTRPDIQVVQE
jgi:hypothetical protein